MVPPWFPKVDSFELGFFSPGNSSKRYLGIWYKNMPIRKVVWVANRAKPINNTFGILTLNSAGNLLLSQNDTVVWNTASEKQARNPVAELLDSGNLVIRNEGETDPEGYLWQSFDYPCDTILPGMKLGWDLRTGLERRITCWKSPDDPSPGDLSWGLVLHNYPEFYLMNGTNKYCRIGPWNGLQFSGLSDRKPNPIYDLKYVSNSDFNYVSNKAEMFYSFTLKNSSAFVSAMLYQTNFSISVWVDDSANWILSEITPENFCEMYGACGPYASCTTENSPVCQCLRGFIPKSPKGWSKADWSDGCVRQKPLSCYGGDAYAFLKYQGLKVPDTTHTLVYENIDDLNVCETMCSKNCSCTAYTNSDISGKGSGCVMWFDDLIDIRQFPTRGQNLYIRMAAVEFDDYNQEPSHKRNKSRITIIATTAAAISGMLLFCVFVIYIKSEGKLLISQRQMITSKDI